LLLGTAETFGIAENMFKDLPFDARRDFAPVALATRIPSVFAMNPSVPAKDMKEFIDLGKKNGDKINFGSPGIGTNIHLISEMLKARYKLDMTHVPYKGGAPAMADLLAGQIQVMPAAVVVAAPHVKAGKLRALAVTSQDRSPLLPDVPTMAEAGVPDFVVGGWFGILAPAGTPQPVLDRLEKEMSEIGKIPEFQQKMASVGGEGNVMTGKEFGQFIEKETQRWKGIVEAADIGQAK
jgi:tripartite-type tricarboxylate transporter receptor subunit TctC